MSGVHRVAYWFGAVDSKKSDDQLRIHDLNWDNAQSGSPGRLAGRRWTPGTSLQWPKLSTGHPPPTRVTRQGSRRRCPDWADPRPATQPKVRFAALDGESIWVASMTNGTVSKSVTRQDGQPVERGSRSVAPTLHRLGSHVGYGVFRSALAAAGVP